MSQIPPFGNREEMTAPAGTTAYAYDDADRITSVTPPGQSPVAWTWDDNGNLTERGSADDALGSTMRTGNSDT